MTDLVWNNYKQMLKKVLESKDSNIIAENSILVMPKLISEIDALRSMINGAVVADKRSCCTSIGWAQVSESQRKTIDEFLEYPNSAEQQALSS